MAASDPLAGAPLQTTEIRVPGANCSWCFNEAIERLRSLTGVASVRASILHECIEVQHHDVSTAELVDTLRTHLHGTDDTSHECQMVGIEPEPLATNPAKAQTAKITGPYMETLSQAINRLSSTGYSQQYSAEPDGTLRCRSCGTSHKPETMEVRETVRFEGHSNPDDQAILMALASTAGCVGQFSAAFGPGTPPAATLVLQRLSRRDRTDRP